MSSSKPVVTEDLALAVWIQAEVLAKEISLGGPITVVIHIIVATLSSSMHQLCMRRMLELLRPQFPGVTEAVLLDAAKVARVNQDRLNAAAHAAA